MDVLAAVALGQQSHATAGREGAAGPDQPGQIRVAGFDVVEPCLEEGDSGVGGDGTGHEGPDLGEGVVCADDESRTTASSRHQKSCHSGSPTRETFLRNTSWQRRCPGRST